LLMESRRRARWSAGPAGRKRRRGREHDDRED
jgi:hypothetical protein